MTTEWAVQADQEIRLDAANKGELRFVVTNPGPAEDVAVFDLVPGEGVQRSWFVPAEPDQEKQRRVPGGNGTVTFRFKVAVPPGTAPGRYEVTGQVYSLNTAPEETARYSNRVTCEVKPVERRKQRWVPILIGAAVLAVVLGVVGYLVLGRSPDPPVVQPSASPSASPTVETGVAAFAGNWVNVDPGTRSIPKVALSPQSATTATLHMWGACSPTPCDWGTTTASLGNTEPPRLTASYNQGFVTRTIVITKSGTLLVVKIRSHFTDSSGRADYDSTDIFNRG
ncbi:MAG TPA: hypothetical protein VFM54_22230 [Micromonosporaceae bacterium]|nr:hypothetical protein [Micromonosporaceae bacterium]